MVREAQAMNQTILGGPGRFQERPEIVPGEAQFDRVAAKVAMTGVRAGVAALS